MANARQLARQRAVQALYSWQLTDGDPVDIDAAFRIENDMDGVDLDYFRELLREIPRLHEELDSCIATLLPRPLAEVDPVERAILRLGAYELKFRLDVPYRVAINEGVELAKLFGAEQGHRFVNGILDGMARELRGVEQAADERPLPEPASPADTTVGKGKFGQKRAPVIRTAIKKRVTRKRIIEQPDLEGTAEKVAKSFAKPTEKHRRKPAADASSEKRAPAKKASPYKKATAKKPVATKAAAKKAPTKSLYGAKETASAQAPAKAPAKKSGASLYGGKKQTNS